MYHSFAPYEQDFQAWWQSKEYPEVSPLTRDFLAHITRHELHASYGVIRKNL
jgi:hypothetical protein